MSYPQPLTPEEKPTEEKPTEEKPTEEKPAGTELGEAELAEAKRRLRLPPIVVICGSTRFMTEMAEADLRETSAGRIVVKPAVDMESPHGLRSDPGEADALKARLGDLHRAKIRLADEVLVVGAHVGDSTRAEITYARSLGKPVRFTHPEADPGARPPAL
ncbi:hypothetical protein [Streptomyces sp. IBSBF 2394]|uniref:hypothetical protein n=1 Tax=Streptomyces sp. IBSBF 2394 TaxID=2903532 RepID=UPI003FA69AA7